MEGVHNGNLPVRFARGVDGAVSNIERPLQRGTCRENKVFSEKLAEFLLQRLEESGLAAKSGVINLNQMWSPALPDLFCLQRREDFRLRDGPLPALPRWPWTSVARSSKHHRKRLPIAAA